MALLTVIFCLVVADGILGTDGHADGENWYVKDRKGLIFFWVSMVLITSVFSFLVEWKHIWVVIPVYVLLYLPISAYFWESPQHTYLVKSAMAVINIGPDMDLLRPVFVAVWFWMVHIAIFFVCRFAGMLLKNLKKT